MYQVRFETATPVFEWEKVPRAHGRDDRPVLLEPVKLVEEFY